MIDAPINIRGLKRMAVDNAPSNTVPVPAKEPATNKRIAIIGGGPSGLSAAYYLELMGHHAVVFEEKSKLGGMLRYGIPSYRFPRERLQEDLDAILSTGVEVHLNSKSVTVKVKFLLKNYAKNLTLFISLSVPILIRKSVSRAKILKALSVP